MKTPKLLLQRAYYDVRRPGAYGGVEALKRATKLKRSRVKDWLRYQEAYTLHKTRRGVKKFARRPTIVGGIDDQWQADLIDLPQLKKANDGYRYMLTVIDVFSKYAWVKLLKDKTGNTLVKAMKAIFVRDKRKPTRLQTDKGTEFMNRTFQQFLKKNHITFFTSENEDIKAAVVERFNRTLKDKLWRYFTYHQSLRYVEAVPLLTKAYNASFHRSIQRAPSKVNDQNSEEVWQTLYGQHDSAVPVKKTSTAFEPGDNVRLLKGKKQFRKGYTPAWTTEIFTIKEVQSTIPKTYVVVDENGEVIRGTFYKQELQKVKRA